MPKSNWDRDNVSKLDENQLIFINGELKQKPKRADTLAQEKICLCPFCFFYGQTYQFALSTGKGFHRSLGQCPNCKNKVRWTTLKRKWTLPEFVKFCYEYSRQGFWDKVKYKDFNHGLFVRGKLDAFWTMYRARKGE